MDETTKMTNDEKTKELWYGAARMEEHTEYQESDLEKELLQMIAEQTKRVTALLEEAERALAENQTKRKTTGKN